NVDANGFRHCIANTTAGSNILYAIHPSTGEARLLGQVRAQFPGGTQDTSMDNANWDETDPNVLYWLFLPGTYLLKGTYNGTDTPFAPGSGSSPADAAITWTVLNDNARAALNAFRSAYNSSDFPGCRMEGIQKRHAMIVCKHGTLQGGYPRGTGNS